MKWILILALIYLWHLRNCTSSSQSAKSKTWQPNTNYHEPKNWLGHKLPCAGSKIIFPEDLSAAIYLPQIVRVKEIELPNDGELILVPDGKVEIMEQDDLSCDKKEVRFKNINIEPWFKPSNWKTNSIENLATPHSERVPCIYDNVIFPNKTSFWVQYPEIPTSVNSFTIEGESLENDQLQSFLLSEPGGRQFKNFDYQYRTDVLTVKNIECTDKSGCLCHENNLIEKAVCKNLQQVCNVTHCLHPVKPIGHCCEICGAYLKLKFNQNNFNLYNFNEKIQANLNIYGYTNIDAHISKVLYTESTYIQIVLIEKDFKYNGDSISAAQDLHNLLISNLNEFNIVNSELIISGPEYWPGQQLKRTIAIVLGTLFLVLISLIIIYFKYETTQGKKFTLPFNLPSMPSFRPFIFVRFENTGEPDTGLEFRNRSVASSLFNMDRAFENPLYSEEPTTSTSKKEEEILPEKIQTDFKNLLYSDLNQQELSDEE